MPEGRTLSRREMIGLVARREIDQRMRARSFLVSTGLLIVAIVAIGVVTRIATSDGPEAIDVAVVGSGSESLSAILERTSAALERDVVVTTFDDMDAARAALEDGEADVAIDVEQNQAVFDKDVNDATLALAQQAWAQF